MSSGRPQPLTLLALVLIVAGGVLWVRGRAGADAGETCDGATDAECVDGVPSPPSTPGRSAGLPVVSEAEVCLNAAYLCADLATSDRIRLTRWKGFDGTVVVHIPRPQMADQALAGRLQRAAAAGVRQWNGQPFPVLVDERGTRDAHFSVQWVTSLGSGRLGLARTAWSPQTGLKVVSLQLVTTHPYAGTPMDPRQVRLVAAHEMGHALGLPHSDEPRDVMYPENTATTLTARDYRTLEALYALQDGTEIVRGPRR